MEDPQDDDVRLGNVVEEAEGIDEQFPDIWITPLRHQPSSLTQRAEGLRRFEDPFKETDGRVERFLRDLGDSLVQLAARSLAPDYPAAPNTHFRRNSSATSS